MKYHIQNLLVVSRQLFYMFFIQALAIQFLFANSGNSQSLEDVTISLQMKKVRLTEIFREIEAKTDFEFAYNHKVNKVSDRLNLEVENGNLQEVLETLASKTPFNFKRINQNIYVVSRENSNHIEVSENVTKSISGKVTDTKTGEPLIGATVVVEGTSLGAITDIDGAFKLSVPDEASTLIVSFTGYLRVSVDINSQTYFEIALEEDVAQLTEVVVLGYDTQTKRDLTGSVATVNPDQVKSLPTASVDKMLDGRMAGVQVLTDNAPGGNVTVRVRGYGTINNNDPLYIVDGVPISNGLNSVNPSDIASIQVLKDASAAAIYGSRAANGVVVITTKTGSSSESKVELNAYTGVQKVFNLPEMLNAQQYGDLLWEATLNDGSTPSSDVYGNNLSGAVIPQWLDADQTLPSDDVKWIEEIFNPAVVQSYDLSVSKGNDQARQSFSLGYYNQEGIIKYTGFDRFTARFNSSYKVKDMLTIGQNFAGTLSRTTDVTINRVLGSVVFEALQYPSIVPVKDINGNYGGNPFINLGNPLGRLDRAKDNQKNRVRLMGNVYAGLELGAFEFKSNVGLDYHTYNSRSFSPTYQELQSANTVNSLGTSSSFSYQLTWSNTISYESDFGDHSIHALLGEEAIDYYYEGFTGSRQEFLYEDENFRYLSYGTENQLNSGDASSWALLSFFGKVNYSYLDKYLFSATIRRDGTSRLSENNWGTFPAFSAGWIISDESFFGIPGVSSMKLRASWGMAGNQQVPVYSTLFSYENNTYYSNYPIDGAQEASQVGLVQTRVANPNLKWEVTTQSSVGLDMGLMQDKVSLTVEYFNKVTDDILIYAPIPLTYGGTSDGTWTNAGQMKNSGLEVSMGYKNTVGQLNYNLGMNLTAYKNELTKLNGVSYLGIPSSSLHSVNFDQEISRTVVGQAIGSFYGYEAIGIFKSPEEIAQYGLQPNAQPGDLIFKDVTGDGVLDTDDRTIIGSPHPDVILGMNMNFYYKGFDLALLFNGSFGNEIYNLTKYNTHFFNQAAYNKSADLLDAWSEDNQGSDIPRLTLNDPNNNIRVSSYYVENGSYFKLYNLQLGYTFEKLQSLDLRVYGQVNNVFTITGYDGMTPEIGLQNYSSSSRNLDIGIDRGIYPPSRTFTLGVNLGF